VRHLATPAAQAFDDLLHLNLGRRGACSNAHGGFAVEPLAVQILGPIDEIAGNPRALGKLAQRLELELLREPITTSTSQCSRSFFTASCRFCVA
jgi:hypothetical protein